MPRTAPFTIPIARPRPPGIEDHPWHWNPNHPAIVYAPGWFRARLHRDHPDLEVTWNPVTERWQVWARAPRIQHPVCQGWRLLFIHHGARRQYLPLDERIFARIYQVDGQVQGTGRQYFDRVVHEMERDQEARERRFHQDSLDQAMPRFDYSRIKNIGLGSKFSTYHS